MAMPWRLLLLLAATTALGTLCLVNNGVAATPFRQLLQTRNHTNSLRKNPNLPLVSMDIAINGTLIGRIEAALFPRRAPRAVENMRLLCTGELGTDSEGRRYHLKGRFFDRIVGGLLLGTGAEVDGVFGYPFRDDVTGLQLKHTHRGLLSMDNKGPDANGGQFSIMMAAAHHRDGKHVIFGAIVSGFEVLEQVSALAKGQRNNELLQSKLAQIVDAGQIRPGSYVSQPEYRAIIEAEKRRVAWRRSQSAEELQRLRHLYEDDSLPLVFLDVAIKGHMVGRIFVVLYAEDSPWASESFRMMCTGEAGIVPKGRPGAGMPYHFKGSHFYRIIENFIDQTGAQTDSPLGGYFRDDPGGLKLNHTRMGLLSMANIGPDTNGAHFSIMMGPAPHLDGRHPIFGEIVEGHDVAFAINKLSNGQPNNELLNSKDAQIVDCGQLRRGRFLESTAFRLALEDERERLSRLAEKRADSS